MLSSTTSVIVCDVDLNLDGQEFAASRSDQRDPRRPVHGDAQRPTQRRSARRRPAAPSTATCSRCCGNARRGAPWRAQRMARARRTARAPSACSSVEAAARTTHATRSAHARCVMVGVHLAASTRPRRAGRRRAGRRRWARHRDCAATREHMTFESLEFACVWAVYYKQIRKSEQRPPLHLRAADLVPQPRTRQ